MNLLKLIKNNKFNIFFTISFILSMIDLNITIKQISIYGIQYELNFILSFLFKYLNSYAYILCVVYSYVMFALLWKYLFYLEWKHKSLQGLTTQFFILFLGLYSVIFTVHFL